MTLPDRIEEIVLNQRTTFETTYEQMRKDYEGLLEDIRNGKPTYRVEITSFSEQGERDSFVSKTGTAGLEKTIRRTTQKFNRLHAQPESRKEYRAYVFHGSASVEIPPEDYRTFVR